MLLIPVKVVLEGLLHLSSYTPTLGLGESGGHRSEIALRLSPGLSIQSEDIGGLSLGPLVLTGSLSYGTDHVCPCGQTPSQGPTQRSKSLRHG